MKVYVIVVTYNGNRWIEKCFDSLTNSSIPLKVLAIDNASSDNTPEKIKAGYPAVELIETGENLGFGKANNIGLLQAKKNNADYVFLLNQDAWIETDTIEKLINISQKKPEFGILSPMHMNGEGLALDISFSHYISPAACPNLFSDIFTSNTNDIYEANFVNAAAWLLTRKCIDVVGGFDPIFPHYGEDVDYVNRCLFHGFKLGISPKTRICHDRNYKPAATHETDINRLFVYNLSVLKSYPGSFRFNFVKFMSDQLCLFTNLLVFRDFSKIKARSKALLITLSKIRYIKKSKEIYSKQGAQIFLSEDELR